MPEDEIKPDTENQPDSVALVVPKQSIGSALAVKTAELGAGALSLIRNACRGIAASVRNKVEKVITEGEEYDQSPEPVSFTQSPIKWLRHKTKRGVYHTVKFGRKTGRDLRWVDKVNPYATTKLLEDEGDDVKFKRWIIDDLESPFGVAAPFIEEIEKIARASFDRGIPPQRLIEFLEDRDVLAVPVEEVLDESHYRGSNIKAIVGSSLDTPISLLKNYSKRKGLKKVDAKTEEDLKRKVEYFKKHYDPCDKKRTVSNFIKELEKRHAGYNIFDWVKNNKNLFIEIIRGRPQAKYDEENPPPEKTRHVANIVNEVYQARGRMEPARFMAQNLGTFFYEYESSDLTVPTFFRAKAIAEDSEGADKPQTNYHLSLGRLKEFFDDKVQKLQGPEFSVLKLRSLLIDTCCQKLNDAQVLPIALIIEGDPGNLHVIKSDDKDSLADVLIQEITETCQFVSSHVDIRNLLFDPMGIPPEMKKNYEDWFDEYGDLEPGPYRRYLRGIFGHATVITEDDGEARAKDEALNKLKARATRIFEEVNDYLASVSDDLGISPITVPSVVAVNDYAELIKIVNTTQDPRERFAARRKIELAALMYTCMITPRFVYQKEEAKMTKAALEHSKRGIDYNYPEGHDFENDKVYFLDDPQSGPQKISEEKAGEMTDDPNIKSIDLIPVKFGGDINCHLVPTSQDNPLEYMSQKSLFSMLTNLLNEDNKRAKDMTDMLRMTFVADSVDDLQALQKYLETNYISFGRSLKRENRYGNLVDASTSVTPDNISKADEYRTLRYVVDIPVHDVNDKTKVYAVPVEIRILLTEDLIKERSAHHPAGHVRYEDRRLKEIVQSKLAPAALFPEVYKEEPADPDNVFELSRTVVKDRRDYAMAA